mmetsp:Transcript_1335/g.3662  ORF Transcript_1335/g.3662 Transcript_1335/m.3662 type:complete len:208 (-) Transcript_1335:487-1110(-)
MRVDENFWWEPEARHSRKSTSPTVERSALVAHVSTTSGVRNCASLNESWSRARHPEQPLLPGRALVGHRSRSKSMSGCEHELDDESAKADRSPPRCPGRHCSVERRADDTGNMSASASDTGGAVRHDREDATRSDSTSCTSTWPPCESAAASRCGDSPNSKRKCSSVDISGADTLLDSTHKVHDCIQSGCVGRTKALGCGVSAGICA